MVERRVSIVHIDQASGEEIFTLLHPTGNSKTGAGYAISHLVASVHPVESRREGRDSASVCRGCDLSGNGCYVNPMSLGAMYKNRTNYVRVGNWQDFAREVIECATFAGYLRFGNFGNPTQIPSVVVEGICEELKKRNIVWTGYQRSWKVDDVQEGHRKHFMYSVMTKNEMSAVVEAGGRAFWSMPAEDVAEKMAWAKAQGIKAIVCPEVTKGVQCRDCGLCVGSSKKAAHIIMPIHGYQTKKAVGVIRNLEAKENNVFEV